LLSLILALALAAQDPAPLPAESVVAAPPADHSTSDPLPAELEPDPLPTGAPGDEYQFVGWCYGALRGYLDLHDEVMPEVTRIEGAFRRPGSKLEDDLRVYADMQKDGRAKLKVFQAALTAAEKASPRPINIQGAAAVRQGQQIWRAGGEVTKARKAQEWMSWVLPARCERTAARLEARAKLSGAALRANAPKEEPPASPPEKTPDEAEPGTSPAQ
jgi:hypothetical protein